MRFRVEVQRVWKIQFGRVLWGFRKSGKFKAQIVIFEAFLWAVSPGPPAGGLEWEFRVEVQRGLGKSKHCWSRTLFLKPSCGRQPPAGGLEWKFRVEV